MTKITSYKFCQLYHVYVYSSAVVIVFILLGRGALELLNPAGLYPLAKSSMPLPQPPASTILLFVYGCDHCGGLTGTDSCDVRLSVTGSFRSASCPQGSSMLPCATGFLIFRAERCSVSCILSCVDGHFSCFQP